MRTKPAPALSPTHKKKSAGKHQLSGGFLSDSVRIRFRAALFGGFARSTPSGAVRTALFGGCVRLALFSCRFHAVRTALISRGFRRALSEPNGAYILLQIFLLYRRAEDADKLFGSHSGFPRFACGGKQSHVQ